MSTILLKNRVAQRHAATVRLLASELARLAQSVQRAREALARNEELDECMIQNGASIAVLIARHNLCVEIEPYLCEEAPR